MYSAISLAEDGCLAVSFWSLGLCGTFCCFHVIALQNWQDNHTIIMY